MVRARPTFVHPEQDLRGRAARRVARQQDRCGHGRSRRALGQRAPDCGARVRSELKRVLTLLVGDAEKMATAVNERSQLVSERLEAWFNDRMARAAGWYKRRAQAWSFALAVVVTVAFNADTLHVATRLWSDAALRETVVAVAEAYGETRESEVNAEGSGGSARRTVRGPRRRSACRLAGTGPTKRSCRVHVARPVVFQAAGCRLWWQRGAVLVGWLVTALAVSLGAAFWFDVLSRALHLRGTGARVSVASGRVDRGALEALS